MGKLLFLTQFFFNVSYDKKKNITVQSEYIFGISNNLKTSVF